MLRHPHLHQIPLFSKTPLCNKLCHAKSIPPNWKVSFCYLFGNVVVATYCLFLFIYFSKFYSFLLFDLFWDCSVKDSLSSRVYKLSSRSLPLIPSPPFVLFPWVGSERRKFQIIVAKSNSLIWPWLLSPPAVSVTLQRPASPETHSADVLHSFYLFTKVRSRLDFAPKHIPETNGFVCMLKPAPW